MAVALCLFECISAAIDILEAIDESSRQSEEGIRPAWTQFGSLAERRHRSGQLALRLRELAPRLARFAVDAMQMPLAVAERRTQRSIARRHGERAGKQIARGFPLVLAHGRYRGAIVVDHAIGDGRRPLDQRPFESPCAHPEKTAARERIELRPVVWQLVELPCWHCVGKPIGSIGDSRFVDRRPESEKDQRGAQEAPGSRAERLLLDRGAGGRGHRTGCGARPRRCATDGNRRRYNRRPCPLGLFPVFRRRPSTPRLLVVLERRARASRLLVVGSVRAGPPLGGCQCWRALEIALEVRANCGRRLIALDGCRREQLGDDRFEVSGAAIGKRGWRLPRDDQALEPSCVGRLKRRRAAQHLVEQHAQRPEVGVRIDLAALEPFGRQVSDAAEIIARDFSAERQRLGDPEVEHLDRAGRRDAHVAGLEISMQQMATK